MSTYINMYSIPEMDMNYDNAPFFATPQTQNDWFAARRKKRVEWQRIQVDPVRTTVTVPMDIKEIEIWDIDYCTLIRDNKLYFYFVTDYDYKTSASTTLTLELDVLQTYMFDFRLLESFVDRCHVDRWAFDNNGDLIPTKNYMDEGLQYGDYEYKELSSTKQEFRDKFIISSTAPLGKNKWQRPSGGSGGGSPSSDCWLQGRMSADGFRFLKGQEAFSPYKMYAPGAYVIAYGLTNEGEPLEFNQLVKQQPLQEEHAAKVTYECVTKYYGNSRNFNGIHTVEFFQKEFKVDSQHKFDALIDLFYTTGQESLRTGKLHDALVKDPNNESVIRPIWENHWTSGLDHLKKRRKAECDIYFGKGYKKDPIGIYNSSGNLTGKTVQTNNGDGWLPECGESSNIPDIGKLKAFEAYGIKFVYPLQGGGHTVNSKLGWRNDPITGRRKYHHGDDYSAVLNEKVYATHDGVVVKADGYDVNGYGNWIILENKKKGIQTYYCHNNKLLVSVGQTVKQGQVISLAGTTGHSTGVHLHYELRTYPYTTDETKEHTKDPIPVLTKAGQIF